MGGKELIPIEIDSRSGYTLADIALAIRLIGKRSMGRFTLMKELGLGEATVKTLMKKLEDERLAKTSAKGQVLGGKGRRIFGILEKRMSDAIPVNVPSISAKPSVAFVVRGAGDKIKKGIEQRDEGVRNGVDVTTLVFNGEDLRFPSNTHKISVEALEGFPLARGDVVIISSGSTLNEAKKGGLAVCLTLL
jgi:hypothetical protein